MHLPFVHRPLSVYINALIDAGLVLGRMLEPAPPEGFLAIAEEYRDAADIPRLLYLRADKPAARDDRSLASERLLCNYVRQPKKSRPTSAHRRCGALGRRRPASA